MIKTMTPEERQQYRHNAYIKRREKSLEYQRRYYTEHEEQIKRKAKNRYRKKCGFNEINDS